MNDNSGIKIAGNLAPKIPMRSDKDIYTGAPGCQDDGYFKANGKPVKCIYCGSRRFYKEVTARLEEDTENGLKGCAVSHNIYCICCQELAAKELYGIYERA